MVMQSISSKITPKFLLLLCFCLFLVACGAHLVLPTVSVVHAQDDTLKVELEPAFTRLDFNSSIFLAAVPEEGRLVVIDQSGRIIAFDDDQDTAESKTIVDLSKHLHYGGEQGLLGLAFDPGFTENRLVYLNYTMSRPRRNVISRMQWDKSTDKLVTDSEKIILEIKQPYSNHNGGMLAFGPDGFLYIGVGDGGSGGDPKGHGQDRTTLLGNLLRIDVHPKHSASPYAIPADNPFINDSCCRPEIYSYGWRNPYRFSFDRNTGDLWVPDVGQNAMEEINRVERGGNYGWNAFEGTRRYQSGAEINHLLPVFEYDHSQGSSITGGYVYRGSALPSLRGNYLYADFVSGKVWALNPGRNDELTNTLLGTVRSPTSFGETADGEVYVVTYNSGIYKFIQP